MPWKETHPVEERIRFIEARLSGERTMAELCREFGISRKTGFKWWARFQEGGLAALKDRSRAAHTHPNQTDDVMVRMVIGIAQAAQRSIHAGRR